jgi:hypothetical protein
MDIITKYSWMAVAVAIIITAVLKSINILYCIELYALSSNKEKKKIESISILII